MRHEKSSLRVLLADSNALFRVGLRLLLENHRKVRVVGELSSPRIGRERLRRKDWDLLVVDPGLEPGRVRGLRKAAGSRRMLVLSEHDEAGFVVGMLEAGADAYASKRLHPAEIQQAVLSAASR